MPDAVQLNTYPLGTVRVQCDRCGRYGEHNRDRLIQRFGPTASMPDVLRELAVCPNWGAGGDPCGAHYPDLDER